MYIFASRMDNAAKFEFYTLKSKRTMGIVDDGTFPNASRLAAVNTLTVLYPLSVIRSTAAQCHNFGAVKNRADVRVACEFGETLC